MFFLKHWRKLDVQIRWRSRSPTADQRLDSNGQNLAAIIRGTQHFSGIYACGRARRLRRRSSRLHRYRISQVEHPYGRRMDWDNGERDHECAHRSRRETGRRDGPDAPGAVLARL